MNFYGYVMHPSFSVGEAALHSTEDTSEVIKTRFREFHLRESYSYSKIAVKDPNGNTTEVAVEWMPLGRHNAVGKLLDQNNKENAYCMFCIMTGKDATADKGMMEGLAVGEPAEHLEEKITKRPAVLIVPNLEADIDDEEVSALTHLVFSLTSTYLEEPVDEDTPDAPDETNLRN